LSRSCKTRHQTRGCAQGNVKTGDIEPHQFERGSDIEREKRCERVSTIRQGEVPKARKRRWTACGAPKNGVLIDWGVNTLTWRKARVRKKGKEYIGRIVLIRKRRQLLLFEAWSQWTNL